MKQFLIIAVYRYKLGEYPSRYACVVRADSFPHAIVQGQYVFAKDTGFKVDDLIEFKVEEM